MDCGKVIMDISSKLCDERHTNIDKEFKRGRERMNGLEKKLWAIIILLITNLVGIIAFFVRASAQ